MKIKEVCSRTGLTERTVRFYVEEGLLHPQTTVMNGREYRDYAEQDLERLETVAELRKLFFTIDEIRTMLSHPDRIEAVVAEYRVKLESDTEAKSAILKRLDGISVSQLADIAMLAANLRDLSENLRLPARDIEPDFGRLDGISKEERETEYQQYLLRQERQFTRGKVTVIAIGSINILLSLFTFINTFRIFPLIISIVLSIALIMGVVWVRYLFAAILGLQALSAFVLLFRSLAEAIPDWLSLILLIQCVYSCWACITLFRSQAVKEFLYAQKNG
ncbi:MerR family transcriptional regulator [Gorillibacterium sp. CAU 1737]|uniref:MerR family transcriptional regulator n=1 Tax=Gorillibacterium sp. CAU 1737 TaxID=3140362 RepID=UPI0032611DD3